jgi:hypothetical protein
MLASRLDDDTAAGLRDIADCCDAMFVQLTTIAARLDQLLDPGEGPAGPPTENDVLCINGFE